MFSFRLQIVTTKLISQFLYEHFQQLFFNKSNKHQIYSPVPRYYGFDLFDFVTSMTRYNTI